MGWEPVLDGALADEARTALREIAEALAGVEPTRPEDLVLFWAYAASALDDDITARRAEAAMGALLDHLGRGYGSLGLHGGATGAGFALAHAGDGSAEELLAAIDATLVGALAAPTWDGEYDLIHGLTGFGVYLLERVATAPDRAPAAREALALVVRRLDELATRTAEGTTWLTRPELLATERRERWPTGRYDLGVAHGVPGTIAVLARIAASPVAPSQAGTLAAQGTAWLLARRLPPDPRGRYASALAPDGAAPDRRARSAWCYGDAGIAVALWNATTRTGAAIEPWRELALGCAARPAEDCGIGSGGMCHGAFGLAHLFNRCYQASRDPAFRAAARRWFATGLREHLAGAMRERAWLLEGAAGIGLSLLGGLGAEETGWDRLLACDVPPIGG